ncbi:phage tail tape measure protein [Pseudomonas parakoreensis]
MSGTIAQLGIEVNSGDAVQAATDLERLAQAGAKAEKAADGVAAGFDKAAVASSGLATAEGKLSESTDDAMKRLTAMAKASLESSEYYQRLTTTVATSASAMDASGSSVSSLAALKRRLQAESDALVGSTDKEAEAAKKAAAATGVQAEGLQALLGKINPAIAALDKLDQQQAQLQKYKAAGLIDADTFREYSARIDASRQKLGDFDEGLKKTGASSKQTETALRQLPSQFTDIFTSLAGGQNPLMVLIQQGGQIKDSFGGIGETFDVLKDKFRSLFTGGAGAAVLGESLAGIATNAKGVAENASEAGESLSDLAESSNTAAEAAENAQKAVGAIGPAVSGVTFSVAGMALAVVAAAAALGTLIYGYSQGSKEADEYNKALILTGNAAGTSAGQLADLAQQVSATNGTTSEAAASLAKLAASGVIAGGSFKDIADAAAAMEDATGKSVDATIAEFVKIAKDPVAAAKELNDQYHFLTASVYSQIVALKEQGDTIGAAKLLTDTYAETVKGRSGEITQNLGTIEKAWKGITDEAKKSLDAIKNIGRDEGPAKRIAELTQSVAFAQSALKADPDDTDAKKKLDESKLELDFLVKQRDTQDAINKAQALYQQTQDKGQDSQRKFDAREKSFRTNKQKRDDELKELEQEQAAIRKANPNDPRLAQDRVDLQRANINSKYKDPKASSTGAVDLTGYNNAQNALKEIQAEYANTQKQLDAAQKAGLISQEAYAAQRSVLIKAEKEEVTSAYQAEIDALEAAKAKKTTTSAQSIDLDKRIADARSSMVKAQKDADSQLEVLSTTEEGRINKLTAASEAYVAQLERQRAALELSGTRAANGLGSGDRQQGLQNSLDGATDKFNDERAKLLDRRKTAPDKYSKDDYEKDLAALETAENKYRDTVVDNYDKISAAQSDWRNGATSAFSNYLESARNIAGQTRDLFTNAFSGMEDAVVNFAITGKGSFSDFTKSILADMARIATRQASSALLSSLVGAGASYFGGAAAASSAGSTAAGYSGDLSGFTPGSIQANGGAWSGGVQMFANGGAFTNSVVSKPTAFGMSGGQTGVMGEAGPEAIMPLTRTAGGQLGVRAISGGGSGGGNVYNFPVAVSVQTQGNGGAASTEDTSQLGKGIQQAAKAEAETAIARALQPGGSIWKLTNGRG